MGKPVEGGELLESRELAASACLYAFIGTSAAAAAAEMHVRGVRFLGTVACAQWLVELAILFPGLIYTRSCHA
jgi:hypothetical protein